ncbi:MFS transporter [Thermodesulfobacteriota bacterium]
MTDSNGENYKWLILLLGTSSFIFVVGFQRACIPVLFKEILDDLGLSMLEIGAIWGMDSFAGMFVSLPAGLIIDRFKIKRVLTFVCLSIGVFSALRGLSVGFISMSIAMFAFGLFTPMMATLVPKTLAVWFDRSNLGFANSILNMGLTVGQMLAASFSATIMSPLLGGWRKVLFIYGIFPILMALLWHFFAREPKNISSPVNDIDRVPFRQALLRVLKIRQVWMLALIMFGHMGAYGGFIGFLPVYLRESAWSVFNADGALTLFLGAISLSSIPIALISDKLGSRKKILVPALILECITLGLIPIFNGTALWFLIAVHGLLRGGLTALLRAFVVETKGVGPTYAGTATGLVSTFLMLGYAIFPPLGNSLAHINMGLPFILWASLLGLTMMAFIFVKDAE